LLIGRYLHNLVEERYKQTGKIKNSEWQSGNNLWLIEILSIKNTFAMMRWVYNYFRKQLKVNHSINWLRTDNEVYRIGQKFKRNFH
jgi:hemolysin-activating ACP:hemolysin acyltransferase